MCVPPLVGRLYRLVGTDTERKNQERPRKFRYAGTLGFTVAGHIENVNRVTFQPISKIPGIRRVGVRDEKERLLELRRNFARQAGSTCPVWTYQQRPIGVDNIVPRSRRISVFFTFGQPKATQQRLLRPILGQPAFRRHSSRFDTQVARRLQRACIRTSLSTTDYFSQAVDHIGTDGFLFTRVCP